MRFQLVLACALLAGAALAQEPGSIDAFVVDLNQALQTTDGGHLASLVAPDADYRVGARLVAVGPADIADALHGPPFSERSAPRVTNTTVRFLSPDVALIDARQIRYGSQFLRQSLPVLLVLRRNGGVWRLHSWRVTPFCRTLSIRYLWRFTSHPAALNGFLRGHEALHCGGTALSVGL